VQRDQTRRDALDAGQMGVAADAVKIDTSALSLDEVVSRVVATAQSRQAVPRG
jgi:cytidylate kinase